MRAQKNIANQLNLSDFEDKSLLILDDDDPLRGRLARAMEKKGFQVKEAKSIIKSNFSERSIEEQISFFKMLLDVADSDDENFILENTNHHNFELKLIAFTLLKKLNSKKLQSIIQASQNIENEKIFNYLEVN